MPAATLVSVGNFIPVLTPLIPGLGRISPSRTSWAICCFQNVHFDHNFRVHMRDDLSSQGIDESEIEANLFAAELLMPAAFLEHDLKKAGVVYFIDDDVISNLAHKYGVSTQALLIRLKNLGYIEE